MKLDEQRARSIVGAEGDIRQRVSSLLRDNGHLFRQAFRRRLKALGVALAEARALMYLRVNEGVAQARLAEILEVQPIELTRIVNRLEEGGWVERRLSEADRRVRLLFLTNEGRRLVGRLHGVTDQLNSEITAQLSGAEAEQLATGLVEINAALRRIR